jgi:hypothetical protein
LSLALAASTSGLDRSDAGKNIKAVRQAFKLTSPCPSSSGNFSAGPKMAPPYISLPQLGNSANAVAATDAQAGAAGVSNLVFNGMGGNAMNRAASFASFEAPRTGK